MLHNTFVEKIAIYIPILPKGGFFVTLYPIFSPRGIFISLYEERT